MNRRFRGFGLRVIVLLTGFFRGEISLSASEVVRDVEYGRVDRVALKLDVGLTGKPGSHPVAILVHGGGWSGGDKSGTDIPGNGAEINPWFEPLTKAGIVWFSVNYRLSGQARWPACLDDVNTAIRWVKVHAADYGGDPARIVLLGHSAGGHLVCEAGLLANTDTRVQGVIAFAPATDLESLAESRQGLTPSLQQLFGKPKELTTESRQLLRLNSPLYHVSGGGAPFLIIQGQSDRTVPVAMARAFREKLQKSGRDVQLVEVVGGPHAMMAWGKTDPSWEGKMVTWLNQVFQSKDPLRVPAATDIDAKRAALGTQTSADQLSTESRRRLVEQMPGLVAFWTFGEEAGSARLSSGTTEKHPLAEVGGPVARVSGGSFSGYSAELNGKQYFSIPYAQTGDLNIHGSMAQVSMFAVVRISDLMQSRTIAGMWSEGKGKDDDTGTRQYALLMNMPTYGGSRQLVPHISSEGGVSRRADGSALPWCADYAATRQQVPEDRWCTLGFTYDGKYIRAYIDGKLDKRSSDPVADHRVDRYFTQEGPSGGDRGMNPYYHGRGIFTYDPVKYKDAKISGSDFTVGARMAVGSMLREATIGRFAGLAVFNRALTDSEMISLHNASEISLLP